MIYQVGDTYYAGALFLDDAGAGVTGLSPVTRIRRASDGLFWTGSGYSSTPTDLVMAEVSAADAPGEYVHAFTPTQAGQYFGTSFEAAGGPPYGGTVVGPVQPWEVYFGIPWTENLDAAVSSVSSAVAAVSSSAASAVASTVRALFDFAFARKREDTLSRVKIPYRTDLLVTFPSPVDEDDRAAITGGSATLRVLDPTKDEVLSADEAGGQTTLSVTNAGAFEDADALEVFLDDGAIHSTTVSGAPDVDAGTIDVADALASAASKGARVRVRLGGSISLPEYGTPKLGKRDWGHQGILPDTHPGLDLGRSVDLEVTFIGGADLTRTRLHPAVVSSRADDVSAETSGEFSPAVTS